MLDKAELERRSQFTAVECDGIQAIYVALYIEAIYYAAERAVAAFRRFDASTQTRESSFEIVSCAHEALGHAAALSRFFFPADKKVLPQARAARLRNIFDMGIDSALKDRELRNALEHFDERLDDYLLGDIGGIVAPSPMVEDAELADDKLGHIFRLVDPDAQVFVLFGRKHFWGPLRCEVERVAARAQSLR